MISIRSALIATSVGVLLLAWAVHSMSQPSLPGYEDVKSIFEDNCIMCHNGPKAPKGLRLDSYESVLKGSENGPVVQPRNPEKSELIRRVRGISTPRMPLSGPPWLDNSEVQLLEDWIRSGALDNVKSDGGGRATPHNTETPKVLPRGTVTYRDVAPIFKANCVKCHNYRGLMGPPPEGFVLASYHETMNGTERAYVVPGNPDASELVRRIRGQSLPRMPFDGPPYLAAEEIALIEKWVVQGAMDEGGNRAEIPVGRKVRLRGTLSDSWVLNGLLLGIGGGTEIKKRTSVGDYVEVRGRVTEKGGIAAERIRARVPSSRRGKDDD